MISISCNRLSSPPNAKQFTTNLSIALTSPSFYSAHPSHSASTFTATTSAVYPRIIWLTNNSHVSPIMFLFHFQNNHKFYTVKQHHYTGPILVQLVGSSSAIFWIALQLRATTNNSCKYKSQLTIKSPDSSSGKSLSLGMLPYLTVVP